MACNLCGRTHDTPEGRRRCAAYETMLDQIAFEQPLDLLDRPLRRPRPGRRRERLKEEDQSFVEYLQELERYRPRQRPRRRGWWGDDPPGFGGGVRVPRRPRPPSGYPGVAMETPMMDRDRYQSFEATWADAAENSSLNKGWKKAG